MYPKLNLDEVPARPKVMLLVQRRNAPSDAMKHPRAAGAAFSVIALLFPLASFAQDKFEIQVYDSQIDPILVPKVELHMNYFPSGLRESSADGELPTHHVARYTLEPQTGLTDWCEVGGYFQTALRPEGTFDFAGVKLRFKARVPEQLWNIVGLALNTEISYVPRGYEAQRWGSELRPIIDLRLGRFYASVNPILSIDWIGPEAGIPQLEPAAKVSVDLFSGLALGSEYYAGLGPIDGLLPARDQTHALYAALDWASSFLDLNLGVGYGGLGAGERWVAKAIVGVQWERPRQH